MLGMPFSTLRQDVIAPGLATFLLVIMCYLAGRVHQYYKQTSEREQAFRDGYNTATNSLFSLATRTAHGLLPPSTPKPPMRGCAPVVARDPVPAKHRAGRRRADLEQTKKYEDWPDVGQAA